MNLPAPFLQREVSSISCVEQGPLSTTLAAGAWADQLAPIHGCGRSCFLWKKGGGRKNRCDPVLWSAGQHAEPSSARCWGNSALCSAVEKKVEAGTHFQKTISLVDPGHSQEGSAATASAAVLAQPWDIYMPPQVGSWPVLFFIFSFKATPAEGKRETPTVSFSRS